MLAAHLVPGYFAAVISRPHWPAHWTKRQRIGLWSVAPASTVVPDLDVLYNWFFRGFFGHTILWTHSMFVHGGIAACQLVLRLLGRRTYLTTLVGLAAVGGISHLVLDVVSHGTPLFYPLSSEVIGLPSYRVSRGGILGYMTDAVFLLEPLLLTAAAAHWIANRDLAPRDKKKALCGLAAAWAIFSGAFLLLLPTLQRSIPV